MPLVGVCRSIVLIAYQIAFALPGIPLLQFILCMTFLEYFSYFGMLLNLRFSSMTLTHFPRSDAA